MKDTNRMQIVAAVSRKTGEETKSYWTKIGVAFQNSDDSWNLRFEYLPANIAETTIQLRPFDPKPQAAPPERRPASARGSF